jgi:hypothetical protein
MTSPEIRPAVNIPSLSLYLPPIERTGYTPKRYPPSLLAFNERLATCGIIRIMMHGGNIPLSIALEVPMMEEGQTLEFLLSLNIITKTVQWKSTYPEFIFSSPTPRMIDEIQTLAAVPTDSRNSNIEEQEIFFLLGQIEQAISTSTLQHKTILLSPFQ